MVYDTTAEFSIQGSVAPDVPATYIFATLEGTIEGWNPLSSGGESSAEIMVNNSSTTVYTGLAAGTFGGQNYIYAANDKGARCGPGYRGLQRFL